MQTAVQEKYTSENPVVRHLLARFFARVGEAISEAAPETVLDAGCGEGELARRGVLRGLRVTSLDVRMEALAAFREHAPEQAVLCGSVLALPFRDASMDAVISLEVLEHLAEPRQALAELARVARRTVIVSVPHEPYFRLGNLARGKYRETWGNHPEHVQHWSPGSFAQFLRPAFQSVRIVRAWPWIIARCLK